MHWHGMHLPARMDGGPHQGIPAGSVWSPSWRITQPAATLWYHPHPHGATEEHTYRGIAGMFIVDDHNPASASLPHTYGVDDLPVIVQDKKFDEGGRLQFRPDPVSPSGLLGDTILVNGTLRPHHIVTSERIRLRLLNASTARVYSFGFADSQTFATIASDGGLLAQPAAMRRLRLSPGERAEIVVTMTPGDDAVLRSYPIDLGGNRWNNRFTGGDDASISWNCGPRPACTSQTRFPTRSRRSRGFPASRPMSSGRSGSRASRSTGSEWSTTGLTPRFVPTAPKPGP